MDSPSPIGRHMGIDLGDKRTGIALCDEDGRFVMPHSLQVEEDKDQLAKDIYDICREESVEHVVIGLPLHMDGSEGARAIISREFGKKLGELGIPDINYFDERLTSFQVEEEMARAGIRAKHRKGKVDCAAACVILQGYLQRAFDIQPPESSVEAPFVKPDSRRQERRRRNRSSR